MSLFFLFYFTGNAKLPLRNLNDLNFDQLDILNYSNYFKSSVKVKVQSQINSFSLTRKKNLSDKDDWIFIDQEDQVEKSFAE